MRRLIDPIELKKSIVVSNIIGDGKTLEELIDEQPDAQPDTGLYTDGFVDGYGQAIKDAAQFQRITVDGVTLYRCDPAKNTACSKTSCFADGGQCYLTKHKDFEKTEGGNNG